MISRLEIEYFLFEQFDSIWLVSTCFLMNVDKYRVLELVSISIAPIYFLINRLYNDEPANCFIFPFLLITFWIMEFFKREFLINF